MTTQTQATTTQTTAVASVGRPLSKRGRDTKRAVARFIEGAPVTFTAYDVRRAAKQSKVSVRNRLNALERQGVIHKVGSQPLETGRGRPLAVYSKHPPVATVDAVETQESVAA